MGKKGTPHRKYSKLTPDHFVYFTKECALVEKELPTPIIQLEIQGDIPWVLDEPNPYHYPDL